VLSEVLLPVITGLVVVPQQTPLAVIAPPPSLVIFPPLTAVEEVIDDMAVVVIEGRTELVLQITSFPYAVPALFVAKALI